MSFKITIKDKGLKKILKNLSDKYVTTVGIHQIDNDSYQGEDGERKQITYAQIGHIHEFGLGNNPVRPWLSQGINATKKELITHAIWAGEQILLGEMKIKKASLQLGEIAEGGIKSEMARSPSPYKANSTATEERKGSNQPLIDTGGFRSRIKSQVNKL